MRRAEAGAVVLLLLLTACTGTITTSTQWSGSWEETFTLTASYEDGEPDSILVNANGSLLPPLARGETSARATIHLFDLPGLYLAIATETQGLLWEETVPLDVADGEELLLTVAALTIAAGETTVTYDVERVP